MRWNFNSTIVSWFVCVWNLWKLDLLKVTWLKLTGAKWKYFEVVCVSIDETFYVQISICISLLPLWYIECQFQYYHCSLDIFIRIALFQVCNQYTILEHVNWCSNNVALEKAEIRKQKCNAIILYSICGIQAIRLIFVTHAVRWAQKSHTFRHVH